MAQEQEDGCYERLNSTLLKSGKGIGNIVCLVGALEATNGDSVDLKCADDGIVKVFVEPDFEFQQVCIIVIISVRKMNFLIFLFDNWTCQRYFYPLWPPPHLLRWGIAHARMPANVIMMTFVYNGMSKQYLKLGIHKFFWLSV